MCDDAMPNRKIHPLQEESDTSDGKGQARGREHGGSASGHDRDLRVLRSGGVRRGRRGLWLRRVLRSSWVRRSSGDLRLGRVLRGNGDLRLGWVLRGNRS